VKIKNSASTSDSQVWELTDKDGNKAALYLTTGCGWDIGNLYYGYGLKGFFEGMDFPEFLELNGVKTIETED